MIPQCWVATSVIALLSGVIMVLVFCRILIVPYLVTEDYVSTDCVISSIEVSWSENNLICNNVSVNLPDTQFIEQNNFTECRKGTQITSKKQTNERIDYNYDRERLSFCVHVKVSYRAIDGLVHKATLQELPRKFDEIRRDSLSTAHCLCQICDSTYPQMNPSGSIENRITVDNGIEIHDKYLNTGTKIHCYYQNSGAAYLMKWESSNSIVLHAILWPTIVFIGGFISLFFSCLALQEDKYTGTNSQKKLSSISIY